MIDETGIRFLSGSSTNSFNVCHSIRTIEFDSLPFLYGCCRKEPKVSHHSLKEIKSFPIEDQIQFTINEIYEYGEITYFIPTFLIKVKETSVNSINIEEMENFEPGCKFCLSNIHHSKKVCSDYLLQLSMLKYFIDKNGFIIIDEKIIKQTLDSRNSESSLHIQE